MDHLISKVAREKVGEIYSPVTLIKGYVDLLELRIKGRADQDSESLRSIIKEIKYNCSRATGIAESLQDLSNGIASECSVVSSAEQILDRTSNLFSEKLKKLGIRLQVRHESPGVEFISQHLQIIQVLACLFDQAIERVKSQTVKGIGVVTQFNTVSSSQGLLVIRVHDSGSHKLGIPRVDFCNSILLKLKGELKLVNSAFGACLELRIPIEIRVETAC